MFSWDRCAGTLAITLLFVCVSNEMRVKLDARSGRPRGSDDDRHQSVTQKRIYIAIRVSNEHIFLFSFLSLSSFLRRHSLHAFSARYLAKWYRHSQKNDTPHTKCTANRTVFSLFALFFVVWVCRVLVYIWISRISIALEWRTNSFRYWSQQCVPSLPIRSGDWSEWQRWLDAISDSFNFNIYAKWQTR